MEMTRSEKVLYVQKSISEGFKPYFEVTADQVNSLSAESLDIELDCARNWQGDE